MTADCRVVRVDSCAEWGRSKEVRRDKHRPVSAFKNCPLLTNPPARSLNNELKGEEIFAVVEPSQCRLPLG
jgi:hypothetical protein